MVICGSFTLGRLFGLISTHYRLTVLFTFLRKTYLWKKVCKLIFEIIKDVAPHWLGKINIKCNLFLEINKHHPIRHFLLNCENEIAKKIEANKRCSTLTWFDIDKSTQNERQLIRWINQLKLHHRQEIPFFELNKLPAAEASRKHKHLEEYISKIGRITHFQLTLCQNWNVTINVWTYYNFICIII